MAPRRRKPQNRKPAGQKRPSGPGKAATQFKPGQSGNPGGRPKSLGRYVREVAGDDGQKLVDLLYLYASGTDAEIKKRFKSRYGPRHEVRIDALRELLDRGFGKPAQAVSFEAAEGGTFTLTLGGPVGR